MHDIYVDDATKVVKDTKFFPGSKPTSVFLDISTYVANLRKDGIEFTSLYSAQEGDIFRVISRRNHTIDSSYSAGTGNGPNVYHSVETTTEFFKDFTGDSALGNDGEAVDLPIISIMEISKDTSKDDYPFALPVSGNVEGGIFLEIDVDPTNSVWGADAIHTVRSHVLQGGNYSGFASQITDNNGYDPDNQYTNSRVDHNTVWKEFFRDLDYTTNRRKPLHRDSDWDKGIRGQIIRPKKRTAARVYHEMGVFENMTDRVGSSPHGTPITLFDGFSWLRRVHAEDPFGSKKKIDIMPYMASSGWQETDSYDALAANDYLDQTRVDELELFDGDRVRPVADENNPFCESFYTFPGSAEKIRNIGRLNVVSTEGERRRPSSLIHSQPYGSETLYNTLQEFFSVDFKDLDINNGAINAITPADQYLMVFQNSKVSRVPVDRNILQTAAGQTSLSVSNLVLGSEQSFNGDYGVSTNQSAVIDIDKTVYFIDKSRRAIIRIASDGFTPISGSDISEKIEKTFIDTANLTKNYSLGYDRDTEHVYFTFQPEGSFAGETYGYDNMKKTWVSRYNFFPLAYAKCENDMLSAYYTSSGWVHRHNDETARSNFYGTSKSCSVTMISTARKPSAVKVYNAVGLESNTTANIDIENSRSQSVSIANTELETKEDRFYKEIPSDGSNLQEARKTHNLSITTQTWKGHVVPLGVVDSIDSDNDQFKLTSKVRIPIPEEQNITLVFYDSSVEKWVSIMSPHILGTSTDVTDGFVEASQITGSGELSSGNTYIEASNFFGTYDANIGATYGTPVGKMLAYIVTTPANVSDTTYSGTTINQPYGGKKLRDYYAQVKIESLANDAYFECYAVTLDVDESKLHM